MNLSAPFIHRPIATILLTFGLALAGGIAFFQLPVSPLPAVDYPTISVRATLPGGSPQDIASTVASPLERHLGVIANVSEMTSRSSVGSTRINLQFGLDRDINGAARDVQAAINAARADLPSNLRSNPTYRKMNPADAPVLILSLTSDTITKSEMYDVASTVLAQKLSQIEGIGEVTVGGSSSPAVRVEMNPQPLYKLGIGLEDVRAALTSANARSPKGSIDAADKRYQIYSNDQVSKAADYASLIIAYRNGAAVYLSDVAEITDAVENVRNAGLTNGKPSVLVILFRQPSANIIGIVDRVTALLPQLQASISPAIDLHIVNDRSTTIRTSLMDVERTLIIAILLVIIVVFGFLRNWRATIVPIVAVSVSLIATFAAMYLLDYSLDNLSLMALTVTTGFVVDDAIVVLENITRHIESGMSRIQAALKGAQEVGFTVLSMSVSLIAVFIPILLMGGIIGRLFREFAVTISISIIISLVISLTTTPMICATLLRADNKNHQHNRFYQASERFFEILLNAYRTTLTLALKHPRLIMVILAGVVGLNLYLYTNISKGFFPQQDTGRLMGSVNADQNISFQFMQQKFAQFVSIVKEDSAVETVVGTMGGEQTNSGNIYVALKPLSERKISADQVIARLRRALTVVQGATLYLQPVQDIRIGGRMSNAQYQYTLQSPDIDELNTWTPKIVAALQRESTLADVNSDQQNNGLETKLIIDRDSATRLGITVNQIDNTLYDAFGQRSVSTIYVSRNQYHVIMEVALPYQKNPAALNDIYISTSGKQNVGNVSTGSGVSMRPKTMIPLSAIAHFEEGATPLTVNHQGLLVTNTISFNLPPNVSLSTAAKTIEATMNRIGAPATLHGSFQGTAKAFQNSLNTQPYLILGALVTIYIVLGILYESYLHPLTILSTLPSAGVGALLALIALNTEFSLIALIGVILLIGIVKKNAIIMIDFAIDAERSRGLSPFAAIYEACLLRFRPIMMTTMAAILGAVPLAIGMGEGSELRRPLGITIVGGLILSQILTLYTTPVIYIYIEQLRIWCKDLRKRKLLLQRWPSLTS